MKDFTEKQSIWDSRGEVSTTSVYNKSIQLKMAKPSRLQRAAGVARNWLIAELGVACAVTTWSPSSNDSCPYKATVLNPSVM